MEKETKAVIDNKLVYFADFGHLLVDIVDETIEDSKGEQFCCHCGGIVVDDSDCKCVRRKETRDGTSECFMSAGLLDLETACRLVTEISNRVIEGLIEKSFICDCPDLENEKAVINQSV